MKKKVLFIGDGGSPTGFATVMHNVIGNMNLSKYDVHHLAVNYRGDPHPYSWKLYPAQLRGDYLGINRIREFSDLDGIFILNDIWVIDRYLKEIKNIYKDKKIPPIVVYFPVDAMDLSQRWFEEFDIVSRICTYTNFAKEEVLKLFPSLEVTVIPHGTNLKDFYKLPLPKQVIRSALFPNNPDILDTFMILNANRNQPRKRVDLTLEGFKLFAEGKPDVRLYCHMGIKDVGWNIVELATKLGFDDKLVITNLNPDIQREPLEKVNRIYNACDAGINTSIGEGWGLTATEHAVTGAVQIVPRHSSLVEMFDGCGIFIDTVGDVRTQDSLTLSKLVSPETVAMAMQSAYEQRDQDLGKAAMEKFTSKEYMWDYITRTQWNPIFKEYF